MILTILSLINYFSISAEAHHIVHSSPEKTNLRIKIPRNFEIRKDLEKKDLHKKSSTPWNGHFSAKNYRQSTDKNELNSIKETLKASIISLPKWHTNALKHLEIKNNHNISRGLADSSRIFLHTSSIDNSQELAAVFIHEMGHITDLGAIDGKNNQTTSFWDGKEPITSDDPSLKFYRLSWENAFQKKSGINRNDFVSGYGSSNCFEDFAETYLFYRVHGDKFRGISKNSRILRQKYQFMKRYVFENKEFQLKKGDDHNFIHNEIFDATLLSFEGNL